MNESRSKYGSLLPAYLQQVHWLKEKFEQLRDAEISTADFSFYTSVASVFSSKIEGENIELDSYIKHRGMGITFLPDYTRKIDDLYDAYIFAQSHPLSAANIQTAHNCSVKISYQLQNRVNTVHRTCM